jgi:putative SOS response-associated peptidase YedK
MCFATSGVFKATAVKQAFDAQFETTDFEGNLFETEEGTELRMYHINGFTHCKVPVITNEQPRLVQGFNWGLIPSWVREESKAFELRKQTLNAKCETLYEKPSFRNAAKNQHCLVLVSGFFEWKTVGKDKIPHYIYCPNLPIIPLAGIYETWKNPSTNISMQTVSIITTEANELMAEIHNAKMRMPVILPQQQITQWLDTTLPVEEAQRLLVPFDTNQMRAHEISKLITSRSQSSNLPEVLTPVVSTLF